MALGPLVPRGNDNPHELRPAEAAALLRPFGSPLYNVLPAQESMLRAFRFFRGYQGGDARAWLLQIVRNTCYTRLQKRGPDDAVHGRHEHHGRLSREDLSLGADDVDVNRMLLGHIHAPRAGLTRFAKTRSSEM